MNVKVKEGTEERREMELKGGRASGRIGEGRWSQCA